MGSSTVGVKCLVIKVGGGIDSYILSVNDEYTWQLIPAPSLFLTTQALRRIPEFSGSTLALLVDEDARLKGSKLNPRASAIAQQSVLGKALLVHVGRSGDDEEDILDMPIRLHRHYFERMFLPI